MPPPSDPGAVDLLERVRAGDREAFRALVTLWSRPAAELARLLTDDPRAATAAVRSTFLTCWAELPTVHSEAPFRPFLLRRLIEAALARTPTQPAPVASNALRSCILGLEGDERIAAALLSAGYPRAEIGLVLQVPPWRAATTTRTAERALRGCAPDAPRALYDDLVRGAEVPNELYDRGLAPGLRDRADVSTSRHVGASRAEVWRALTDPAAVETWAGDGAVVLGGGVRPGTRVHATGALGRVRTSDEHIVTRVELERALSWVTRATLRLRRAPIELRWQIEIDGEDRDVLLTHTLRAVAFPPGRGGARVKATYARVAELIPALMHRRLEQIAVAATSRRNAPL